MTATGVMSPEDWFVLLERALSDVLDEGTPGAGGVDGGDGAVDAATRSALLDLARVAAHASERWAAPVSTWLAGLALADVERTERAERIARLVAALEAALTAAPGGSAASGGPGTR